QVSRTLHKVACVTNTCSLESLVPPPPAAHTAGSSRRRRSMDRYASERCTTFEELFEQAREGTVVLDAARYPPSCSVAGGSVRLTLGPTGAMIVHVEPGPCRCDDFRDRFCSSGRRVWARRRRSRRCRGR